MKKQAKKELRLNYKWVTIALCFLMVMVSLGFASSTKSLFPDVTAEELGVERSLVSIGDSCRYVATAIINIFFGTLIAKFGAKKLICAGFFSLMLSMILYSVADNLALIYLAGALLGVGFSWTSTTMVGYVVDIWCAENKGTIMGMILASNGLGGAIAIQLVGGLIRPEVVGSYRVAYRVIAIIFAVTLLLLLLLFRDKPKNAGDTPRTPAKKTKKRGQEWVGISFSQATKKFYFWGTLIYIFFSGMILQGTYGIVAMHLKAVGIDYGAVKGLLSFGSIILASAKFLTGFVYDKFGLRVAATFCTVISVASTFLLASVKGTSVGFILALIYTVISQFAMPLETIMLPILATDLFGKKSYAKILGFFVSASMAGFAIGSPLLNLCFDLLGSYVPALIIVGCIMTAMLILLQFIISSAHKERERVIAQEEAISEPTPMSLEHQS